MAGSPGGWNLIGKGVKGKLEGSSTQREDTLEILTTKEYKQQWMLGILLSQPSSHNSVTRTGHWWSSTQLSLSRISSAVVDILSLCPVMSTRKNLVGTLHTGKFLNGFCPHGISYSFKATLIPMLDVCLAVQIVDGRQMHS